jgi:CubicO group peptidase (beta-lactamase class C family)
MKMLMCKAIAATGLAMFPLAAPADPVDDLVAEEMRRGQVPGVAVGVIDHGVLRRAQGYGLSNLELAVPVHPDTLFKSGAMGMQLTAAGILLLTEEGRIGLDEPVRKYLPELPRSWAQVTVRQLLNHTSGVPATPSGDFQKEYTEAELLKIIAGQETNFHSGARWRFSYAGYVVLGFMIRRVTGESYVEFLQKRLFAPAGMTRARGIDESAIIPGRASGYELRDGKLRNAERISATANSTADGSLYLSVLDYAAWAQALARKDVLSEASWAEMAKPAQLADGTRCGYGLGWFQEGGEWSHAGSWQGFQTFALRYPAEDLTVVVLANGEAADAPALGRRIAGELRPGLGAPSRSPIEAPSGLITRTRALLDDLAADRVTPAKYVDFAKVDLTEMVAQYATIIAPLGARREVALFAAEKGCGGTVHRLRARYDGGVIELRLIEDADRRISSLDIVPVSAWNAPF